MSDPVFFFFRKKLCHCYLIQVFWLVAKIAILFSNFLFTFIYVVINSSLLYARGTFVFLFCLPFFIGLFYFSWKDSFFSKINPLKLYKFQFFVYTLLEERNQWALSAVDTVYLFINQYIYIYIYIYIFFQAAVVSILLYGCTTWTLTKRLKKKLDGNYTRMLRAILNKSWRQHPTRYKLYGNLPPITKTIQVRRARHAGHCCRSNGELISDVLLWTPAYGQAKAGRPARTYIRQLCEDSGCNVEDLPKAMNDREKYRERVRDIRVGGTTWWW